MINQRRTLSSLTQTTVQTWKPLPFTKDTQTCTSKTTSSQSPISIKEMASITLLSRKRQWHADHQAFFARETKTEDSISQRTYVYDSTSTIISGRSLIADVHPREVENSRTSSIESQRQFDCACCHEYLLISDGENIQGMLCKHLFHTSCITAHLDGQSHTSNQTSNSCPKCKLLVLKVLRPVWYDALYSTQHHFENGDLVIYQTDGFVPFWRERAILEYELKSEMASAMLAASERYRCQLASLNFLNLLSCGIKHDMVLDKKHREADSDKYQVSLV